MAERKDPQSRSAGNGALNGSAPLGAREEEERQRRRGARSAWPERREPIVNSISVARMRTPDAERTDRRASESSSKPTGTTTFDPQSAVPAHIQDKYVRVGARFHFPDGDRAFRVSPTQTTTQLDSPEVVRDMIEIEAARANGEPLRVRGTEKFRAEAWRQAKLLGVEVQGYRPSKLEQAQVEREQFEQAAKQSKAGRVSVTADPTSEAPTAKARHDAEHSAPIRTGPEREPPVERERARFRGVLVAHGPAPYLHDRHNDMSYYATLETRDGKRTVWGKDIERAVKESLSDVKHGDRVVIQHAGQTAVTVKKRAVDHEGNRRTVEEVEAYRNRWIVETQALMKERAELARVVRDPNITPQEAVRRHPSLAGIYLNIQAAKAIAKDDHKSEAARRAFIDRVRNGLADEVAKGEKLPVAELREQTTVQQRRPRQQSPRERAQVQERVLS